MRKPAAATPMAFVRAVVLAYAQRGFDPTAALEQAQIAPSALHRTDARITAAQLEEVSAHAMRELDDEALGWFSRRLPWGSYGMLARASSGAPTLDVALKRWCRHHGLLTDDVRLTLETHDGVARLRIEERRALGALREFCLVTLLRNAHGLSCWWIDARVPLIETRLPFAAPAHVDVYPLLFPGSQRFGAEAAGFDFDAAFLARPLCRDETALNHMLQRALPLTVWSYRRERQLAQRVRQLVRARPHEAHSAASLAAQLHVSVRTLHRLLAEEGTAVQTLKDEARRDHAMALLARTQRPIKQVAQAVGYASAKSFARAYRQWTSEMPSQTRHRAAHEAPGG
jgi:AraC-like DNA-binding protein